MDQEPEYRIEPLESHHDRAALSCGVAELDRYIHNQAGQDRKRDLAVAFVLTSDGKTIAEFYTLSQHSIQIADLPEGQAKKLPSLPIGVTLLGRMAMSQGLQGHGLGEFLPMDTLARKGIPASASGLRAGRKDRPRVFWCFLRQRQRSCWAYVPATSEVE
jgi:hypothetical protein